MKCYFNDCAGEGKISDCCFDCEKRAACTNRCPMLYKTPDCIWLTEGKEHEAERLESETGTEDPDLH